VQQNRLVLPLQKFERACEQRNVVSIDRSVIAQSEFLEYHTGHNQTFETFFDLVGEVDAGFSGDRLNESARFVV
jgi:hypothetical protein